MISFSRYNTRSIDKRIITYGRYGIAFSKSWLEKNRIHEVLYINKNSVLAQSLADLLIARRKNATTQLSSKIRLSIMNIKCFTKNAVGYNSYLKMDNFVFRNENEWRFVPTKREIGGKFISLSRKNYLKRQKYFNEQLLSYLLSFQVSDIEYLFVKSKNQVDKVLNSIPIDRKKIKISNWRTTFDT